MGAQALAIVAGGRAAVADVSPETLLVGAVIVTIVVAAYVVWKRRNLSGGERPGDGP